MDKFTEIDGLTFNDDRIPVGWEVVKLSESELDNLCYAADSGDFETANEIVKAAYDRLFGESIN